MRSFAAAVIGGGLVAVLVLLVCGQPGLAQQPARYVDISQDDFKAIDSIVRKILEPLKKGGFEEFKKLFRKHGIPDLEGLGEFAEVLKKGIEAVGNTRDIKYVRHESVKNVTDYYVFYYADQRETDIFPWSFTFYKVKGEWKVIAYRFDMQSPVEFFRFGELQYNSFTK
jgi:hypothetical protein